MLVLIYAPTFVRQFNKLPDELQDEVLEKVEMFKNDSNHEALKVHKLHGKYKNCYGYSVNYICRIIFQYGKHESVAMLSVGNHDVYK